MITYYCWKTWIGPRVNTCWRGQSVKILIMIAAAAALWSRERPNLRKTSRDRKKEAGAVKETDYGVRWGASAAPSGGRGKRIKGI